MTSARLPDGFLLGAATSAYQIEGRWNDNGKGESIWDRFAHTSGTIRDGTTGDTACDHLHRWREDLDLISKLGLDAYRFSVSWPRVLPQGVGPLNERGMAFYDRLVDALLARGIRPFVTLYHWDLPQALQDQGGWAQRDTVDAFCRYARLVSQRLGDRVRDWITINEPSVIALLGHVQAEHAPGHHDPHEAIAVAHHLLLAHGASVPILRAQARDAKVGIALAIHPIHPASDSAYDRSAADRLDAILNRSFLDPLVGRGYPDSFPAERPTSLVHEGDMERIAVPIDFLGVNYYMRHIVRSDTVPESDNAPRVIHPRDEVTDIGWEIYPEGLLEALERLCTDYGFPAYYVTENGAAIADRIDPDGAVRDPARIAYLERHLLQAARAAASGVPLRGYFVWSLLDNFEWAYGLEKRFGLIYVDFSTQRRIPKSSYAWFRAVTSSRTIPD